MRKIILFVSVILLTVGCSNSEGKKKNGGTTLIEANENITSSRKTFATSKRRLAEKPFSPNKAEVKRKLIKTGSLTFETKDLSKTKTTIEDLVKSHNGYVASDREYKSYDRISNTISLRVPSNKFDDFVIEISKGVDKFENKNINISDVTEQFLDVEARLKTKKALEAKYLEILKKAKTVREILDVERELGKLRGDIEATEGRLKYLTNQVSFSTLTITFYKKIKENETGFGSKLKEAFKDGFKNIKAFFLFIIKIWPFIIILFLVFFYFRRRISRAKS